MQGATRHNVTCGRDNGFQSTPPMQGATRYLHERLDDGGISIHAPHAGGDSRWSALCMIIQLDFNPRPPCRGRPRTERTGPRVRYFNPRPPCRGRRRGWSMRAHQSYFNPRPPCRGRPAEANGVIEVKAFQSTPPMQGATTGSGSQSQLKTYFNPRPPCRGRLWLRDSEVVPI